MAEIPLDILLTDGQSFNDSQELDTAKHRGLLSLQSSDEGQTEYVAANEENRSLYALKLKEFAPLMNVFRLVPCRAQHGFSTVDIRFTCLDVVEQYICIGSNVGMVFVYNRKQQSLQRLRCEGYSSNITSVKILYSLDYLVACSTESGSVVIFKVPANDHRKEAEKFNITGVHKHPVTCLEWGQNGMKLFSGDAGGQVVYTEIDYLQNRTKSQEVLKEKHSIVQLSYRPHMLLVSTTHRSVFCRFENTVIHIQQIGQKPRKCTGKFGAVFNQTELDNDVVIYASRPGLRLWKADTNGVVKETMLLKDIILKQETNITLLNRPINPSTISPSEMQFGKIKIYQSLLLLTWNEQGLFIMDPDIKMIVGNCLNLKLVVDVAVCNDEIFVLQGHRHLIRIASAPEEENSFAESILKEPASTLIDFFSPIQELGNILKSKNSTQEQTEGSDIFSWLHKKFPKTPSSERKVSTPSQIDAVPLPEITDIRPITPPEEGVELNEYDAVSVTSVSSMTDFGHDTVDKDRSYTAPLENLAAWNESDEPSDFKVYHVRKRKKGKNGGSYKAQDTPTTGKSGSVTSLDLQESTNVELPIASYASSLSESVIDTSAHVAPTRSENMRVERTKPPFKTNEDDLLDHILNRYTRSKDNVEDAELLQLEASIDVQETSSSEASVVEEKATCSSEASIAEEKENTIHEIVKPDVTRRSYPDVVPALKLDVVENLSKPKKPLNRHPSEEVDIYSSLSPSSPLTTDPETKLLNNSLTNSCSLLTVDGFDSTEGLSLDKWVKYEAPGMIVSVCVTSNSLYCVDSKENFYFTSLKASKLHWKLVKHRPAHQVAVTPSGTILWILYKGSVVGTTLKPDGTPARKWLDVSREVMLIALDDTTAWYIKNNGKLRVQRTLDVTSCSGKSESASCPWLCRVVTCRNDVVWALTCEGTVICKNGPKWEEIPLLSNMWVSTIALGAYDTAWLISDKGNVWFRTKVTSFNPKGMDCWWQVEVQSDLIIDPSAHKTLSTSLPAEKLGNLFLGHQKASVTVGPKGVWFSPPQGIEMLASCGSVVGHCWKQVKLKGIPDTFKWNTIAVVGFHSERLCGIWSIYKTGEMFFCTPEDLKPVCVANPDVGGIICLAASISALWTLTKGGLIHMRKGMTSELPLGSGWENVDTRQLGDFRLVHISCSPEIVWGCLDSGDVVARVGPLYSPPGLPLVWLFVDEGAVSPLPSFTKVWVSPESQMVWAVDSRNSVYVRQGIKPTLPIGTGWTLVSGLLASHLSVATTHVLAVATFSCELYTRCGISETNCAGMCWNRIPGYASFVSATSSNMMWGLSTTGQLLQHNATRVQFQTADSIHSLQQRKDSKSDEDWELI